MPAGGRERLARPGDPRPRALRPGQRGPFRADGYQFTAGPEQHRLLDDSGATLALIG